MRTAKQDQTHDDTIPLPDPARKICHNVGTECASSSWIFMKKRYDANTRPFIRATVACRTRQWMHDTAIMGRMHAIGDIMPLNSPVKRSSRTIVVNALNVELYRDWYSGVWKRTLTVAERGERARS